MGTQSTWGHSTEKMKSILFIALTVMACTCVLALEENDFFMQREFEVFQRRFGKTYAGEQHEYRYGVFRSNWEKVQWINAQNTSAQYGVSKFMDLTEEEFGQWYLNRNEMAEAQQLVASMGEAAKVDAAPVPKNFDWVTKGAVTPVKNQGQCGSCWAFSTTGNLEGQWFLAKNNLTSFSEQQLVDCDKVDQGCNGGLPSNGYEYIMKAGGIETESDYPYTAMDGQCQFDASKVVGKVSNWTKVTSNEEEMASWLVANGPISIGINAEWMQFYLGGVSDPLFCDPKKLDHGVLITGFGTEESGKPYWIIKNSWGAGWGHKGYYWIIRGKGKCGLNTMATSAIVA